MESLFGPTFLLMYMYVQCAKNVVSNSLGLVDFVIGLVNLVLNTW